jgi:hypothetical protein
MYLKRVLQRISELESSLDVAGAAGIMHCAQRSLLGAPPTRSLPAGIVMPALHTFHELIRVELRGTQEGGRAGPGAAAAQLLHSTALLSAGGMLPAGICCSVGTGMVAGISSISKECVAVHRSWEAGAINWPLQIAESAALFSLQSPIDLTVMAPVLPSSM